MTSQAPFLCLPREMRDAIYEAYLLLDDGYVFDFECNKLRTSSGQPIDLSLMYTCRLVAAEMAGLPLRTNTVTFRTVYSDTMRTSLGRFEFLLQFLREQNQELITCTADYLNPEMRDRICQDYPDVYPFFDANWMREAEMGEHSRKIASDEQCLLPGAKDPGRFDNPEFPLLWIFDAYSQQASSAHSDSESAVRLVELQASPWTIWSEDELDKLIRSFTMPKPYDLLKIEFATHMEGQFYKVWWDTWGARAKARASAAAVAIRFLQSYPRARNDLRRIVVDEDHEASAFPECHAKGLIPFCRENQHLRVERRVSLWNSAFHRHYADDGWSAVHWFTTTPRNTLGDYPGLDANAVSENIAVWLEEASVLCEAGMPRDVFTLILDGRPAPAQATRIFQEVVQRDAAWQLAAEARFLGENLNTGDRCRIWLDIFRADGWDPTEHVWMRKEFPRLLADLGNNVPSSHGVRFRANFDVGQPWTAWEVAQIIAANEEPELTVEKWGMKWYDGRVQEMYETEPPLPPFPELERQQLREVPDDVRKLLDEMRKEEALRFYLRRDLEND
ncbi:hypothetical protein QBC40DRAFT_349365 [Triangularia verruculosa]|uniref:Uncharacterized protein n=1 Tax=Triangularia verruculosa TaxID=2587418 RepID=A0AAN7AU53_9PEZI|nr:hypothetical protein QBC40DRAFT_349365 [Triangularia verruculosa]